MAGYFGMGSDMNSALGYAPATMYSGLDPSASAGAYGGNPLGGGIAGQAAGGAPVSSPADNGTGGTNQMMQMMLMQQALQSANKIGQAPIVSSAPLQASAPQASVTPAQGQQVNPAMLGMMMNRSA